MLRGRVRGELIVSLLVTITMAQRSRVGETVFHDSSIIPSLKKTFYDGTTGVSRLPFHPFSQCTRIEQR